MKRKRQRKRSSARGNGASVFLLPVSRQAIVGLRGQVFNAFRGAAKGRRDRAPRRSEQLQELELIVNPFTPWRTTGTPTSARMRVLSHGPLKAVEIPAPEKYVPS